jgi:hypothetical protein
LASPSAQKIKPEGIMLNPPHGCNASRCTILDRTIQESTARRRQGFVYFVYFVVKMSGLVLGEILDEFGGSLGPHIGSQLLVLRLPDPLQTAEGSQQDFFPHLTDSRHTIQF